MAGTHLAVAAGIRQFYKAFGAHPPKRVCGYDSVVEAWNAAAYETGRWDSEQHKKFWQDHRISTMSSAPNGECGA